MRYLMLILTCLLVSSFAMATSNVAFNSYTITAGSTTAYVQTMASTPVGITQIYCCDTSTNQVKVAAGAAGSEVDLFTCPVSACAFFSINPYLPAGTRLSLKGTATLNASGSTTGYNSLSLLP